MRTSISVAIIFMATWTPAGAQDAPRGGKIDWRRDVEAALEAARLRPAMLYFTDDG